MSDAEYFEPDMAVLRWAYVVQHQCDRLIESATAAFGVDVPFGEHPRDVENAMHVLQGDRHFLLVAARLLHRALTVSGWGALPDELGARITALRDVLEHWDEFGVEGTRAPGRAGRAYRSANPDGHPLDDIAVTHDDDLMIGGEIKVRELGRLMSDLLAYIHYPHARIYPPIPGPVPKSPLIGE